MEFDFVPSASLESLRKRNLLWWSRKWRDGHQGPCPFILKKSFWNWSVQSLKRFEKSGTASTSLQWGQWLCVHVKISRNLKPTLWVSDSRLMRQLWFHAEYDVTCSLLAHDPTRNTLESILQHNFKQIDDICMNGSKTSNHTYTSLSSPNLTTKAYVLSCVSRTRRCTFIVYVYVFHVTLNTAKYNC